MAIAATGGLVHLPFADRQIFGSPYPQGIAVGHIDITGDVSGGGISATFLADTGFLYRLEVFQSTRGNESADKASYASAHRWATDRSGRGLAAFDLNWVCDQTIGDSFSVYKPFPVDLEMLRRFPMGRTANDPDGQIIWSVFYETNTDAIIFDVDLVLTYWRQEAMFRPGFLASFWEAPIVPPPLA